jgi:hypothetical protein
MSVTVPIRVDRLPPEPLPIRASVPFPAGAIADPATLGVLDARGTPLPSQARTLLAWPDGSVRWAHVVFEPPADGDEVRVVDGAPRPGTRLAGASTGEGAAVSTGAISFAVERPPADVACRDRGVLTGVRFGGLPVTGYAPDAGLVATDADGRISSSQKAGPGFAPSRWDATMDPRPPLAAFGIKVVEAGPVRALLRIEGRTAYDAYRDGLDYRIWLEAYAGRSIVRLRVAWIHRDPEVFHHLRDIRFRIPLAFVAERASFGGARGAFEVALPAGRRCRLVQADADRFEATRREWDGRVFDVADGAAGSLSVPGDAQGAGPSGAPPGAAPGWALLTGPQDRSIALYLPAYREEHPSEIAFDRGALEFGLWPDAGDGAVAAGRVLPPLLDGVPEHRHRKRAYECLIHHPYRAFLDPSGRWLETVQGVQKTREAVLDFAGGLAAPAWERRIADGALEMPVGTPVPEAVRAARVILPFDGADHRRRPRAETALERAAAWFDRHAETFGATGLFDWGDLRYLVMDGRIDGPWRGALEEHARAGYWNNNEEDPVHGLFLHALRTGSPRWRRLAERMGRHFWDVDVRHHPPWGVHTHTEGHCFRSQTWTGTDHFWMEGLLDFYLATGETDVLEGVRELATVAAAEIGRVRPAATDLRTVSLAVAQLVRCAEALGDPGHLGRARAIAADAAADATADGFVADYGSAMGRARSPSLLFATLFIEAVGELDRAAPDPELRAAATAQLDWYLGHSVGPDGSVRDPAETWGKPGAAPAEDWVGAFQLLTCLGHAFRWTEDRARLDTGRRILDRLLSLETGDPFDAGPSPDGRPAGQIRPLGPATALRCLPGFLAALDRES